MGAAKDNEMKHITVLIGGRPYPLKINTSDEPAIRKIVKEINEKLNRFQLTYTNKDKQDCLSMTLLTYAVELHKVTQAQTENASLKGKLSLLNDLLDNVLT